MHESAVSKLELNWKAVVSVSSWSDSFECLPYMVLLIYYISYKWRNPSSHILILMEE